MAMHMYIENKKWGTGFFFILMTRAAQNVNVLSHVWIVWYVGQKYNSTNYL